MRRWSRSSPDSRSARTDALDASRSEPRVRDRGSVRAGSVLLVLALVAGVVLAGVVFAPTVLDELDGDAYDVEPPEAGDRNPPVTDPDDPGESTHETDEETVSSDAVEDRVHERVNDVRADHGLEPIDWDGTVASVSRAHSQEMAETGVLAHENADGETPFDRFNAVADYCGGYGENVARTSVGEPVERAHDGERVEYHTADELAAGLVEQWLHSDAHRATILESSDDVETWDRGGVGVVLTEDGEVFATHNFCTVR